MSDPERELIEGLVARLRAEPAAFADVRDLARRLGLSAAKLEVLCRRHYHADPREMLSRARVERACRALLEGDKTVTAVGSDAGYETRRAFHADFRGRTGMSPQSYRRLPAAERFAIELPPWYPLARTLAYLGRDPASPTQRVDGRVFAFALAVDGAFATAAVKLTPGRAACAITPCSGTPAGGWGPAVHGRLLRLLGLTVDPLPFERRMRRSPEGRRLIDGQRGLTIPQTHDLVDGLIWVIVGQQVSLGAAFALRRRLAERFGRRLGAFVLPPTLETLAGLGYGELQAVGFSRRKEEYLLDLARAATAGELDLEALERATATEVEERLTAVRGLGPWSVHYLMMRVLALADCVPVGDVALAKSLATFFGLAARPDKRRVEELMAPFAPYRSLATFHLWNRLGNNG